LLAAALVAASCSGILANVAASALSGEGSSFRSDDDPELVKEAIPFGLKTMESVLESTPDHAKLLGSACAGFTQYAYAFVQQDAEELESTDPVRSRVGIARTKRLLHRAVNYGFHGLEVTWGPGFAAAFEKDRAAAVKKFDSKEVVPLLYWTAASLGALISLSKDDMKMVGRLPQVEALMKRALELDEDFSDGAIHEFYVTYDNSRSESNGGGIKRAKEHYDRVLAITGGKKIGVLVSWAEAVAVQNQDRKQFDQLLDQVLAFNVDEEPRFRLVNLIAQRRARFLKSRVGDLFLEE
jgi:hypothetical protein